MDLEREREKGGGRRDGKRKTKGGYEEIEWSVMAMEYEPHRDAYQTISFWKGRFFLFFWQVGLTIISSTGRCYYEVGLIVFVLVFCF